ncbi:MAG: 3-methyl-2-oxobutanoate hydroxymethyltransferase [Pseudomonadota bacterium]
MSAQKQVRRKTPPQIRAMKGETTIVSLTAYTARLAEQLDAYCDFLLVGDSLGMVVYGLPSTLPVTIDMMCAHGAAVVRGSQQALVVVDMPFGSYEAGPELAFDNAAHILKETGAGAVKLEGGRALAPTIEFLTSRGIPVMAHIGLQPQSVNMLGGYGARGKTDLEYQAICEDAAAVEAAGAFSVVIEGVVEPLAREVTSSIAIPTIGIGASHLCDGQVLVTEDMLGMFERIPKFVRRFGELGQNIDTAARMYADAVRARTFPSDSETY